jgi:hypothetical protein
MNTRRLPVMAGALLGAGLSLCPATGVAQRRSPTVAEVQVTPDQAQVQVGRTAYFVANAFDASSTPISNATPVWSSSNGAAATIDQNGMATGVAPGITIITARFGGTRGKTGQATLEVLSGGPSPQPQAQPQPQPPPGQPAPAPRAVGNRPTGPGCAAFDREPGGSGPAEALLINPLRMSLVKGELMQLDYRPVRGDGTNADRVCVVFGVDPGGERVAMVDSTGMVSALSDTGRAVVRATVPGTRFVKQVSVEVHGDSVRFEARELSMSPGATDTLVMLVPTQSNRRLNPVGIFQFQSSDESKVRVSPVAPIVTAIAPGTARILAQNSAYPGDIPVTIHVHRAVAQLMVAPADTVITLAMQGTRQLRVEPRAADTTVIPEVPLHWTMPDSTVVRFDPATKTLRGLKMGETRIGVSVPVGRDSLVRQWRVRVVAGGLAISPASRVRFAMGVGERTPIAVQLLDDHKQPIGPATDLTWSSSDSSVARVSDGQVNGLGMGHAQLKATARWDSAATADVFVVGDMVVTGLRVGRWDLYMLASGDQMKQRQLTQDSTMKQQPTYSPNWMQIAYVQAPGLGSATRDLWIADADGSNRRQLTNDSAAVQYPSFVRPSGEQIVFESDKGGHSQVYIINRDGTNRRQLTTGDDQNFAPEVSPDGRKIIFYSLRQTAPRERHYNVYQMNIDGTGVQPLTNNPKREISPAYAPDGRSFFYLRDEGGTPPTMRVYQRDLTTNADTPITPVGTFVQAFRVSGDGGTLSLTLAFADANGAQTTKIALFNLATKTMTDLVVPGAEKLAWPSFRPQH